MESSALNIVIPMAGAGKRFIDAGYTDPKPFIDVLGTTMIERVLENVHMPGAQFILIARSEHLELRRDVVARIDARYAPIWLTVDALTEGAACTVLLASRHINTATPLIISNCDELIHMSLPDFLQDTRDRKLDASIVTFSADHPKWSYVAVDEAGYATQTREKQVISSHATAGIYFWQQGSHFMNAAAEMIARGDRTNSEYYVAPAYNYLIQAGGKVGIYEIKETQMHGLGTPEDLEKYLAEVAQRPDTIQNMSTPHKQVELKQT